MLKIDPINLLSLVIALAAYIGAIRLAVIGRMGTNPAPAEAVKTKLKLFLRLLIPADVAFIIAGFLLFLRIFWSDMFHGVAPTSLDPIIVWSFFAGVIVLMLHHVFSWYKSFS